ncbi:sugar ABC transporter permease [Pseudoclostridium thermosuccinogenes]|jgi:ABC-type sugar transport system permease subunit|uniref:carbohydrate ABC transporter permease n=1 Tax=Clostridium thermosuccinogenes TaxID=84032 RepID=UPI000CCC2A37|nr:sugar ABC transporter permease [Pseudoclostridium thermosuccinogenes]PNT90482.1 hypothetical protein CDQ83_19710 [Pseudoclostridium thermosuccinogenes]
MKAAKNKKKGFTIKQRNALAGYIFFSPWIIGFFAFTFYPVIYSLILSVNAVQIKTGGIAMTWKGLTFYHEAVNIDTSFKIALGDTVMFIACATPLVLVFSLIVALLLNGKYPLRTFLRAVFFLPVIIMSGPVISELLNKYTADFTNSDPKILLFLYGLPSFIQKPVLYALSNLVLILWFSGTQILIFLAGLQKIGRDIYEAAEIDGANSWEKFWKITLPFIKPMAMINAIYTIVEIANFANNEVNKKISGHLFEVNRPYSFSAAMSWIYFITILLILLVVYVIFSYLERRERA